MLSHAMLPKINDLFQIQKVTKFKFYFKKAYLIISAAFVPQFIHSKPFKKRSLATNFPE